MAIVMHEKVGEALSLLSKVRLRSFHGTQMGSMQLCGEAYRKQPACCIKRCGLEEAWPDKCILRIGHCM